MLTIVQSPAATMPWPAPATAPEVVQPFLQALARSPQRVAWVVPTSRRRRALQQVLVQGAVGKATLLPQLHTMESLVNGLLSHSPRQLPPISGPERLLRVARCWQEVSGTAAGPGLARPLDRLVRDWQACDLPPPSRPRNLLENMLQRYLSELERDQRHDRNAALRALNEDLAAAKDSAGLPPLARLKAVIFDGFHRLEPAELRFIGLMSHRMPTLAWLVGAADQVYGPNLQAATDLLRSAAPSAVTVTLPAQATPLQALGRTLFPLLPTTNDIVVPIPGLHEIEAPRGVVAELEEIARRIKADYLNSQGSAHPLRLSDIAIVIPGPAYDTAIREVFPSMGLEFNLAGRALLVGQSRPARLLFAALSVIQGQWRYEHLLDFVRQPLVKRNLERADLLSELMDQRPRSRQRLSCRAWIQCWRGFMKRYRQRAAAWASGELELPERVTLPRDEFVRSQLRRFSGLMRLLRSLRPFLSLVARLERAIRTPASNHPPFAPFVAACRELMQTVQVERWLSPPVSWWRKPASDSQPPLPWVEFEKDQQAYHKLLTVLEILTEIPEANIPVGKNGRPDLVGALKVALSGETYQIRTQDDAGIQIFESREIRGLRFRHVYALGMTEEQLPTLPDDGVLAEFRVSHAALAAQARQLETEPAYLFAQLFEAAGEMLVFSCPRPEGEARAAPSQLLEIVRRRSAPPPLPSCELVASSREAAVVLGRAHSLAVPADPKLTVTWPAAAEVPAIVHLHDEVVSAVARRPFGRQDVRVTAPELLAWVFPSTRAFSPSELEVFAACPFRYFGTRVLRLEEDDTDPTRAVYGSLVHRVLQRHYHQARAAANVGPGEPLPAVEARAAFAGIVALFNEEAARLPEGTMPPDLIRLFGHESGVVHLLIEAIATLEAEFGNLFTEHQLQGDDGHGVKIGEDERGNPVFLACRIDRVDITRGDAQAAIVLDYKTGKPLGRTEFEAKLRDGRALQLPLYGAVLEASGVRLKAVAGAYLHICDRDIEARNAVIGAGDVFNRPGGKVITFDPAAARRLALEMVGKIRAGVFGLTEFPSSSRDSECTSFCPLRDACRHPAGYKSPQPSH